MKWYLVVAIFALINIVSPLSVPITKCAVDDSKCIKENTQALVPLFAAGIPDLGIETMDPVFFKSIKADNGRLKLRFDDITLTGLKSCRFKKIQRDAEKHTIAAKIHCNVVVDGLYEMDGQVLILPVRGKGKVHIEHEKIEIQFNLNYNEESGEDGKTHWKVNSWEHQFEYKGETKMEFDNLFNGNKVLASAVNEFIKTSANVIAKETAGPIVKTIVDRIIDNVKIFFNHIPVEDFVLN